MKRKVRFMFKNTMTMNTNDNIVRVYRFVNFHADNVMILIVTQMSNAWCVIRILMSLLIILIMF